MLAELFDRLQIAAESAMEPTFHTHGDLPGRVYVAHPNGEVNEVEVPPKVRHERLDSFDSMLSYLLNEGICRSPEVYVMLDRVAWYLDAGSRRDVGSVPLHFTERFVAIEQLAKGVTMSPKAAIFWLRRTFAPAQVAGVIKALGKIDFKRSSHGTHRTERGRETLGKSVEAEVQQVDEIPENFVISTRVWSTVGFTAAVDALVEIDLDPEEEEVVFFVQKDELEKAKRAAVHGLAEQIGENMDSVPVFMGSIGGGR